MPRSAPRVLFILLLLLVACANPNGQGLQDYGTITGRLIDDRSGQPVTVSPIYITVAGKPYTTIDSQGGFVLSGVPIGQQTVTVSAIGYITATALVSVQKDQASSAGDIRLRPANS